MKRTIHLPQEQVRELERLAADEHRSVDEFVQLALGDYLARRNARAEWAKRLDEVVAQFRAGVPTDMTPEEIEAEITANWEEYRAERSSSGGAVGTAADARGR